VQGNLGFFFLFAGTPEVLAGFILYNAYLNQSYSKKSDGVKSSDLYGHSEDPSNLKYRSEKTANTMVRSGALAC
jgi:hypothetical protein